MSEQARQEERWKNRRRRHLKDGCHELMRRRRRRDIFSAHNNQHRSSRRGVTQRANSQICILLFFRTIHLFCPRTSKRFPHLSAANSCGLLHSRSLEAEGPKCRKMPDQLEVRPAVKSLKNEMCPQNGCSCMCVKDGNGIALLFQLSNAIKPY